MSGLAPERAKVTRFNTMLAPYQGPEDARSARQLLVTAAGFIGFWYAAFRALEVSYGLTLLLAIPTAGFLVRLFMIQHDCGHGSFFSSKRLASIVGHWIGVVTLTPFEYWRRTHAYHHAHSGDLDLRGFGDVDTLTVDEYLSRSVTGRLAYRLYRHPLVLFGGGALFHFLVKHRYPWDVPRDWKAAWRSVWLTNLSLAGAVGAMVALVGWQSFLLVHGPVVVFTCAAGVWLFYVQHQFEEAYWERKPEWDFYDAALKGSSHLVLPPPLRWFTADIGVHHVHHMSPRIPNYRLNECLDANPDLSAGTKLTFRDSWRLLQLSLWDPGAGRLIGFRELEERK